MTGRRALVILLAAAAAVLAGGAGGGTSGPLSLLAGTSGGGQALGDVEPTGMEVPFLERGRFWLAVQIRNDSGEAVTVVDAHTPQPAKSLVMQTATRLGLSPQCVLGPCDFTPEGIEAKPLAPVAVPPGGLLGVRLEYRVGTCADAARASYASGDELAVDYRDGAGALQRQSFPIGRLRLIVRKPAGVDCVPRPFSQHRARRLVHDLTRPPAGSRQRRRHVHARRERGAPIHEPLLPGSRRHSLACRDRVPALRRQGHLQDVVQAAAHRACAGDRHRRVRRRPRLLGLPGASRQRERDPGHGNVLRAAA